jgi:hypothetical protein
MKGPTEGIYRRLSVRMYSDEKFMRLSPLQPSGQGLWVYLITGPHTSAIPGVFVVGRAALAETLNWPFEAFSKAFDEVIAEGLAQFDERTRLWFIPNAIHHNMPANPNVVRSWRAAWALLPECDMRGLIAIQLEAALRGLSEPFAKAFEEVTGKPSAKAPSKGSPKQEAGGRKQEKEKKTTSSSAAPTVPCPYDQIVAAYHEHLPGLPRVKLMPASREKALRKAWGWVLNSTKSGGVRRAETAEQALQWFREYFARAAENDFLTGRTPRSAEHANWKCDLDFLLTDKGMKQVIEKTEAAA